jgi:hypothetical protein
MIIVTVIEVRRGAMRFTGAVFFLLALHVAAPDRKGMWLTSLQDVNNQKRSNTSTYSGTRAMF